MNSKASIIRAHQAIAPYVTYLANTGSVKRMGTKHGIKDCLQDLLTLADHEGIDFTACLRRAELAFNLEKNDYE